MFVLNDKKNYENLIKSCVENFYENVNYRNEAVETWLKKPMIRAGKINVITLII